MASQKIENVLNLSLDATIKEREQSQILGTGYDEIENTWEVIIKYNGDILRYQSEDIRIEPLIAGYAIVTIKETLLEAFVALDEVEYVEKPKRLYFATRQGILASCIGEITQSEPYLTGNGVLIAIIDSGIDYYNDKFRDRNQNTRIAALWDQTVMPEANRGEKSPDGFNIGTEYTSSVINEAIRKPTREEAMEIVRSRDVSGHGTAVAGIAADVATTSRFIVVKLGRPDPLSFPRTTEMMRALKYVVEKAVIYNQPVAINVSFGNSYGSHDGTSLLERYMDNIAEIGRNVVCVGSGNEGSSAGHYYGKIAEGEETEVELAVTPYETGINLQLWKNYGDDFRITLISPSGQSFLIPFRQNGTIQTQLDGTQVLIYVGEPTPYSVDQEIFFDFIPNNSYVESGIWRIGINAVSVMDGRFNMYLPAQEARNMGTSFFRPTPDVTLTIPSTSSRVITVGAYSVTGDSYADFSGRGYVTGPNGEQLLVVKPDIVAPGVGITVTTTLGTTAVVSGTSFATPFVTGGAALLMEWGIVRGNDLFLYGEKLKAYLQKGARPLRGESVYPNERVGWGKLCVADSIPKV